MRFAAARVAGEDKTGAVFFGFGEFFGIQPSRSERFSGLLRRGKIIKRSVFVSRLNTALAFIIPDSKQSFIRFGYRPLLLLPEFLSVTHLLMNGI